MGLVEVGSRGGAPCALGSHDICLWFSLRGQLGCEMVLDFGTLDYCTRGRLI